MSANKNIALSVIIPVYNSEKTIQRCLESIIKQGITEYECIVVDDGSYDSSYSICEGYASNYPEIRVSHTSNKGASNARNIGIADAHGDYITFIDSDDALEVGAYKEVLQIAYRTNSDVVCFGMKKEVNGRFHSVPFIHTTVDKDFIRYKVFSHAVVNKLIKRSLIINNNVRFNTNLTICEDLLFSFKCIVLANKVSYIDEKYYMYYENITSVSHNKENRGRIKDYERVADCIKLFCIENGLTEQYGHFIDYRYTEAALQYLINSENYNPSEYRRIGKPIKVWHYTINPTLFLITLLSSLRMDLLSKIYVNLRNIYYRRSMK